MSKIKLKPILNKTRVGTSFLKDSDRKERNQSSNPPRSSSVSNLRLKNNKLNENNNNNSSIIPPISLNNNSALLNLQDRGLNSERLSMDAKNELMNKELFDNIDIFIEKDLMEEELIDEDNKIKTMLNNLIFWDKEHLVDRKDNSLFDKSLIDQINKEKQNGEDLENQDGAPDMMKSNNKSTLVSDTSRSQKLSIEGKIRSIKLKYDMLNPNIKHENNKSNNKFDNAALSKEKEMKQLLYSEKDRKRLENAQKEELNQINQRIILNKYKKKKYNEVLNNTYHLLDKARTEYNLSIDLLEKRIESTQKYYEAILQDFEVQYHFKKDDKKSVSETASTIHTTNTKKGKAKTTTFEIYEAKIKSYREYLSIVEDINNEIKKYDNNFKNIQLELNELIKNINRKLEELNLDTSGLKKIFKELCYNETQYYLALLRNGRDTRKDGLSWIIKRLMELNIPITQTIFPKFLDKDQINYIILMGKLEFEKVQLKTIIERIKERGKSSKLLEKNNININELPEKNNIYKLFNFNNDILNEDSYQNLYGSKIIDKLMKLYSQKYIMKNKLFIYKKQNNIDSLLIKNMKKKINIFAHNKDEKIFSEEKMKNNIHNVLNVNEKGKEHYYNILVLKDRERKLNWYIRNLRKKEFLLFKEKYRAKEIKDIVSKLNYQQMFNALFGKNDFD